MNALLQHASSCTFCGPENGKLGFSSICQLIGACKDAAQQVVACVEAFLR